MNSYFVKVDKAMNLLKEAINECEDVISHDPEYELFYERMDRNNLYDIVERLKPILSLVSDDDCYSPVVVDNMEVML